MTNTVRFWKFGQSAYRDIVKQADVARDSKNLQSAARLYRQALTAGAPKDIRKQLANMLKDVGNYDEAFFQYNLCLESDPDNPDTLLQLGHLYKLQKQYAKASVYYARAEKSPTTAAHARRELDWLQVQPSLAPVATPQAHPAASVTGDTSAIPDAPQGQAETSPGSSGAGGMQHLDRVLVEELRNSFDALVPLFLNTASTIGRIGRTVEDLAVRVRAIEQKAEADPAGTTRG